jgi:hypothetical protein
MFITVLFCPESYIEFCPVAYTTPTYLHMESGFVMYVYNTTQYYLGVYTTPTHLHMAR